MPLAWSKVVITGSSRLLVQRARAELGVYAGKAESFVANLGVDYSGGRGG